VSGSLDAGYRPTHLRPTVSQTDYACLNGRDCAVNAVITHQVRRRCYHITGQWQITNCRRPILDELWTVVLPVKEAELYDVMIGSW